MKENLRS